MSTKKLLKISKDAYYSTVTGYSTLETLWLGNGA